MHMRQANIADNLPFDAGLAHAVVKANASGWVELSHCVVDQTFETLRWPFTVGQNVAGARNMGHFLDLQAQLNQRALQAALDCSKRISEIGFATARDVTDCLQEGMTKSAEAAAQHTASTAERAAENVAAAAEQTRQTMSKAADTAQQETGQAARTAQPQRPAERRAQQPGTAH
jgi:hypothetical protein